ncbi:MAG TPA: error-prone DNA polymerase [Gammaproteobacteria bacterium]
MTGVDYAELHCLSNFTFLRGASHPEELIERAAELEYAGLALTDECSVAGVVRAHTAARKLPIKLVVGSELTSTEGLHLVVLAADRAGYGALCRLLSMARLATSKGEYRVGREDIARHLQASSCLVLWLPDELADVEAGAWLKERFDDRIWLAVELLINGRDRALLDGHRACAEKLGMRAVASGNVHMHIRERRRLQDTLTAIRLKTPVEKLGFEISSNAERVLRPFSELVRVYPRELLRETLGILERIEFSLDQLRYEYPAELVPQGETPASYLRWLTEQGARRRWPHGVPAEMSTLIEHELTLIGELAYEPYFLTVHDIVGFARGKGILCQGRGSAANSAVCYCLRVTEVDPARMQMLMERFISKERNEPPDIDVDFEHERREEVIQYIYRKYSRERAALAATVITYQAKSATRDVGKALGLDEAQVSMLTKSLQWWDETGVDARRIRAAGLDPESPKTRLLKELSIELMGFPRHLSQHVGGFVISAGPLTELVPVENAAMPERTVIQWDKDDLEELKLIKVDVLGLGMLSALRRSFELMRSFYGREFSLADVPAEDPVVYDMICKADTIGVFQIESRAQMAMLPRLKPRCYYDLVIEVAIIRPGPIQGDMVHPYLRRRAGEEPVVYPSDAVKQVLERTLGVPLFQEQVMRLAVVAAGFTPGEADQLRRAMAAWRRRGEMSTLEERLIDGMLKNGYTHRFAEQIFNQIRGFGEYGFPESHAASFALLVYVSAWLKCREPAIFFCALLNSQPMGFYAPAQLVRAAREHGVDLRTIDVALSQWDSSIERTADDHPALRLGLRIVKGFSASGGERLCRARAAAGFISIQDLAHRARLDKKDLGALASAGALGALAENRHRACWQVAGVERTGPLLEAVPYVEGIPMLRRPSEGEDIVADYRRLGLSLRRHPLALLRARLKTLGIEALADVRALPNGAGTHSAGLVITRQRPSSAAGVTFVTVEDESGYLNLIVWERLAQRAREVLLGATLLGFKGKVQKEHDVVHVIAERLYDHSSLLGGLTARSRDFH